MLSNTTHEKICLATALKMRALKMFTVPVHAAHGMDTVGFATFRFILTRCPPVTLPRVSGFKNAILQRRLKPGQNSSVWEHRGPPGKSDVRTI